MNTDTGGYEFTEPYITGPQVGTDETGSINSTEKIDKPAKVYYFGDIGSRKLPDY